MIESETNWRGRGSTSTEAQDDEKRIENGEQCGSSIEWVRIHLSPSALVNELNVRQQN